MSNGPNKEADAVFMRRALANGAGSRLVAPPNPWVGAVLVANDATAFDGATEAPGKRHAEIVALDRAGPGSAVGATLYTTLEPCNHQGRTGPCTEAIIKAGVRRVVVGVLDPDPQVRGEGVLRLKAAGIHVDVGEQAREVREQLRAYLHHRRTGRPFVILKMAATLDGRTAAPDQSSQWITGSEARQDVHRLRAESDAVCVGAGTVRKDDPSLTVRDYTPGVAIEKGLSPRRIVLGAAPEGAKVHPCTEYQGELLPLLEQLGKEDVLQLLVEGGAETAGRFHRAGLVDRYVIYLAPALLGGDDGTPLLSGVGAPTMAQVQRGRFVSVAQLGSDVRLVMEPTENEESHA